jgi:hypothetical protein
LRQADWFDGLQIFPIVTHGSQILWTIDKLLPSCNSNFQRQTIHPRPSRQFMM